MTQAYDAIIATITVASGVSSVVKAMIKSTTWRLGTSGDWLTTDCTLEASNIYQFRTPLSGMVYGTTAILPNINSSVTIAWDTSATAITSVGNYFMNHYARDCDNLTSLSAPDTSGLTTAGTYFMAYYAYGCDSLTSLSAPDTSGLTSVGDYFIRSYAYGCASLTSLSVLDLSGLTSIGDWGMAYYAFGCDSLTSLSIPDTSGLTSVGTYFMAGYAGSCVSLTTLILPDNTGWFTNHDISWSMPSTRLGYLYGYCKAASLASWQALTVDGKTLYTNYIQESSYVLSTTIIGETTWGHVTGVVEDNALNFAGHWTGTGSVSGTGDSQAMYVSWYQYMQSEVIQTELVDIELLQNNYGTGDTLTLKYRTGSTEAACEAESWVTYTVPFTSLGYVQLRVEGQ